MKKFILICGGVISGVGKGIATASIGKILQEYGYKVTAIKIDPYINFDAGTLRPTEHGEVFVTYDGGEIDQDLGSYERFLNIEISKINNITTGQIYGKIIKKERKGEFLGKTVQFIPHVPDEIKRRLWLSTKRANAEITLIELGGTIGDYENIPFLFAIKSLEKDVGKENMLYVLVSYLPVPQNIGEMKTKPTQQAIKMLAENGIYPDIIIARSSLSLDRERKEKIERYANIPDEYVISAPDIKTVYRVPINFEKEKLGLKILKKLNLKPRKKPNWKKWKKLVNVIENSKKIKIAMIGKYITIGDFSLTDSYISINEALTHASAFLNCSAEIEWLDAIKIEKNPEEVKKLKNYHGILIPGGFGITGIEGKIRAIKFARENNIPFLGLCLGMQLAVIEYARSIGLKANSTEFNPETKDPVICILPEQKKILEEKRYGATMRLGEYAAILKKPSLVYEIYKKTSRLREDMEKIKIIAKTSQRFRLGRLRKTEEAILERHRHRYEVNPSYINILEKNGLVFSAYHETSKGTKLMEFLELPRKKHKFFLATQSHPEFKSRFLKPSPVFLGFVEACKTSS